MKPEIARVFAENFAVYGDVAVSPIEALKVDAAARYEHFTDFGSTFVAKLTGRYDFNTMIAVRGTISSGFRAPTLAEEFYSGTNVAPGFAFGQIPGLAVDLAIGNVHDVGILARAGSRARRGST